MNTYSSLSKDNFFETKVSEKIQNRNLKNFLITSLKINNINIKNKDSVFLSFVDELNEYQIFILKENYRFFEFQVFEIFYENKNKEAYDLYICDNFFCLYKNGAFYYYQYFSLDLPVEEFIEYLDKKFQIKILDYKIIDKNYFQELKELYLKKDLKNQLNFIKLKKDYSFYFFIFYIFILIFAISWKFFEHENLKKIELKAQNEIDFRNIKNNLEFKSFYEKLALLFQQIDKNNLELISFEFKNDTSKIVLNTISKEKIYSFLEDNKVNLKSSTINFLNEKNIYEVVLDVRIF